MWITRAIIIDLALKMRDRPSGRTTHGLTQRSYHNEHWQSIVDIGSRLGLLLRYQGLIAVFVFNLVGPTTVLRNPSGRITEPLVVSVGMLIIVFGTKAKQPAVGVLQCNLS